MAQLQTLNLKHFQIAHLLAQGKSQAEVARRLNISSQTIYNCMDTPEFREALETLKDEYAEKLTERALIPFEEMQRRINIEAAGALDRIVGLSNMADKDSVRLKANLALLDRSSNTPKAVLSNAPDASRELFSVSVVQMVLETAMQVGDKSILKAAERALEQIPASDDPNLPPIDIEPSKSTPPKVKNNPFLAKTLDDVLLEASEEEEEC